MNKYTLYINRKYIVVLLLSIIISCASDKDIILEDQKVYSDIFQEIIEETFQDFRKMTPPAPPPPAPQLSEKEREERFKSLQNQLDTIKFAPLYVIIKDTVKSIPKENLKKIFEEKEVTFIDTNEVKKDIKIDISKIKVSEDYLLIYKSELQFSLEELKRREWEKYSRNEERNLHQYSGGILNLTRVYFNQEIDYGFLEVGFYCGKLCGCGYRVFVKKIQNKWVIDKIENLGCA